MKTTPEAALQEILFRKDEPCGFAAAAALHGIHPAEILARLSFAEFSQLVARIQAQSAPDNGITKEIA